MATKKQTVLDRVGLVCKRHRKEVSGERGKEILNNRHKKNKVTVGN